MKKNNFKFFLIIFIFVFIFVLYFLGFLWRIYKKAPYFMVVINPAHGGISSVATTTNGERYDDVLGRYTLNYDAGYRVKDLSEFEVLHKLSFLIKQRLDYTKGFLNWKNFEKILIKYGKTNSYKKVVFDSEITKPKLTEYYLKKRRKDVNKYFRLFDSYQKSKIFKKHKGILSFINKYKPEIVINLDFNKYGKNDERIFGVVVPHYEIFNSLREKIITKSLNFDKRILFKWYGNNKDEKLKNLVQDTWTYFVGILPDASFFKPEKFIGIGYNSLSWDFKDKNYKKNYYNKEKFPQYSQRLDLFKPKGRFWFREKNYSSEKYKRLKGDWDVGDNEYINFEIIRYITTILLYTNIDILKYLNKNLVVYRYDEPSLFVNSLTININLGSFLDKKERENVVKNLDNIADAICIALYSICAGYKIDSKKMIDTKYLPSGRPVNFIKYYKYHYIGRKRKRYY